MFKFSKIFILFFLVLFSGLSFASSDKYNCKYIYNNDSFQCPTKRDAEKLANDAAHNCRVRMNPTIIGLSITYTIDPRGNDRLAAFKVEATCAYPPPSNSQFKWNRLIFYPKVQDLAPECSASSSLGHASLNIDGSGSACYRGCNYRSSGAAVTVTLHNGERYRNASNWSGTGQSCTASSDDNAPGIGESEVCKTVNSAGSQHCINQNGEQCIIFKDGTKHCWTSEFNGLEIVKNGEQWINKKSGDAQINPPDNAKNPTTDAVIKTEKSDGTTSTIGWGATGGLKDGTGNGNSGGGNSGGGGNGNGNGNGNGDGDGNGDGTSAGGGSNCGDPPTCSGDAATCAVYRQVWLQRCDGHGELDGNAGGDFDLPGDIDAALNDEGDDSWRSNSDDEFEKKEINGDVLLSKLDSSGFLGGGTCPPPANISIGGKASMTFSFATICEMLASASYLVMMLAYYLAIRIITKTK